MQNRRYLLLGASATILGGWAYPRRSPIFEDRRFPAWPNTRWNLPDRMQGVLPHRLTSQDRRLLMDWQFAVYEDARLIHQEWREASAPIMGLSVQAFERRFAPITAPTYGPYELAEDFPLSAQQVQALLPLQTQRLERLERLRDHLAQRLQETFIMDQDQAFSVIPSILPRG